MPQREPVNDGARRQFNVGPGSTAGKRQSTGMSASWTIEKMDDLRSACIVREAFATRVCAWREFTNVSQTSSNAF